MFEITRLELLKIESARTVAESMKASFGLIEKLHKEHMQIYPQVYGTEQAYEAQQKFEAALMAVKKSVAKWRGVE